MRWMAVLGTLLLLIPALLTSGMAARAEAYVLAEAQSGAVLAEKEADVPRPVGSLAKLMTAYVTAQAVADVLSVSVSIPLAASELNKMCAKQ